MGGCALNRPKTAQPRGQRGALFIKTRLEGGLGASVAGIATLAPCVSFRAPVADDPAHTHPPSLGGGEDWKDAGDCDEQPPTAKAWRSGL